MTDPFKFEIPSQAACKCCGGASPLYGVVDFNKNCARVTNFNNPRGIPIYYYRCTRCGFLFSTAMDHFTHEDFARWIYNKEYVFLDRDAVEVRPRDQVTALERLFKQTRDIRILDYGAGTGRLVELLRENGFKDVTAYDPFVPKLATRPQGRFDLVLSFEVVEHSPRPWETFADMDQFMKRDGLIVFSTHFQTADVDNFGTLWWYVAPRNGHVSIYNAPAIQNLVRPLDLKLHSFSEDIHCLFRTPAPFAMHLFKLPSK